jgi:plastocyanin
MPPNELNVFIEYGEFSPYSTAVAPGQWVTWINKDEERTYTLVSDAVNGPEYLGTGPWWLSPGQYVSLQFTEFVAGTTFRFYDLEFPDSTMGTVAVSGG